MTVPTTGVGTFSLLAQQQTISNEFNAAQNGTFGSGANPVGSSIGAATNFNFESDGTITPGQYTVIHDTDASDPRQANGNGLYYSFQDQDAPGSGYIIFYDAQNSSAAPTQTLFTEALSGLQPDTAYQLTFDHANIYTDFFAPGTAEDVFPDYQVYFGGALVGTIPGGAEPSGLAIGRAHPFNRCGTDEWKF
jgi:hypothetical protein